jgi:hypothetical protein
MTSGLLRRSCKKEIPKGTSSKLGGNSIISNHVASCTQSDEIEMRSVLYDAMVQDGKWNMHALRKVLHNNSTGKKSSGVNSGL